MANTSKQAAEHAIPITSFHLDFSAAYGKKTSEIQIPIASPPPPKYDTHLVVCLGDKVNLLGIS